MGKGEGDERKEMFSGLSNKTFSSLSEWVRERGGEIEREGERERERKRERERERGESLVTHFLYMKKKWLFV